MKHAVDVAQVISNSKQQAALFEHKPPTTAAAAAEKTHISQQAAATAGDPLPTAVGPLATEQRDGTDTHAQPSVPVTSDMRSSVSQQSQQQPQQQEQQQKVHSQPVASTFAIKPKTLKPITIARGSSAFSMTQPKRPAMAQSHPQTQPLSATQTAPVSHSASPSTAVLTRPQADKPALNQPTSLVSDGPNVQVSANGDMSNSHNGAVLGTVTAATALEQASEARDQNPSAMRPAFSKQPRAVPQIRAAAGGLFGAAQPRATALASQGTSAGLVGDRPQSQEPDLAAVNRLRAQFSLPFAVAPAERQPAAAMAGKRPQPEGQEPLSEAHADGQGNEGSSAQGIRAVVDALQAEKPSNDAVQPASKKQKGTKQQLDLLQKVCSMLQWLQNSHGVQHLGCTALHGNWLIVRHNTPVYHTIYHYNLAYHVWLQALM